MLLLWLLLLLLLLSDVLGPGQHNTTTPHTERENHQETYKEPHTQPQPHNKAHGDTYTEPRAHKSTRATIGGGGAGSHYYTRSPRTGTTLLLLARGVCGSQVSEHGGPLITRR
uniref:Putative secreted protein n=1 Tax=Anopheles marajoara TaxID=58244 RepID=A0A2M4C8C0_9DIPT